METFSTLLTVGGVLVTLGVALIASAPVFDQRARELHRAIPRVDVSHGLHEGLVDGEPSITLRTVHVTNTGAVDVVVSSVNFQFAQPEDSKADTGSYVFPVREYGGRQLPSVSDLPLRLRAGDTFTLYYDSESLIGHSADRRLRVVCRDTQRRSYYGPWITFDSLHSATMHKGPGEGFREPLYE